MTPPPPGRRIRTHTAARVPTHRSQANCRCTTGRRWHCPLHSPALYALESAVHRGEYQDERP